MQANDNPLPSPMAVLAGGVVIASIVVLLVFAAFALGA